MKCLLVSRIDLPGAISCARQIKKALQKSGVEVIIEKDTAVCLGEPGVSCSEAAADAAVVIGGDGTILRTVQQLTKQIPIIGINHGEVGFLADLEPEEAWEFIRTLVSGFEVEKRMRLSLFMNDQPLGEALNEALIVTTRPAKMLRFSIIIDGRISEQFRSDGLLVSTPTGSTAYAMSAGGPIVDPRIEGFLVVPLAPYMMSRADGVIQVRSGVQDGIVEGLVSTQALAHLTIGVDDTDTQEGGATFALALALLTRLTLEKGVMPISHHVVMLCERITGKTAGNSASYIELAVPPSRVDRVTAKAREFVENEALSAEWGMAVYRGMAIPPALREYGKQVREAEVSRGRAEEVAGKTGIVLYGGNGVIGALGAVALARLPHEIQLDPSRKIA